MAALTWLTVAAVIPQEFLSLGSHEVALQQPHQHLSTLLLLSGQASWSIVSGPDYCFYVMIQFYGHDPG